MKIKEFLLQKVNKDTLKKESVQRAIKVTICCAFIFALIFQLVGCLFGSLSVYAAEEDSIAGTWIIDGGWTATSGYGNFNVDWVANSVSFGSGDNFRVGYRIDTSVAGQVAPYPNNVVFADGDTKTGKSSVAAFIITFTGGADINNSSLLSWLNANGIKQGSSTTCPTLPELLRDYTGTFDSIVDMLNTTNYDQYEETVQFFESQGYLNGYDNGLIDGYDDGYQAGVSSGFGENILGATFNAPLTALNQWVLFETSGGIEITMGGIFSAMLALSILIIFIKMFAGG